MRDVFLLGAGFSKAVSKHMPLLSELGQMVSRKVPELDTRGISKMLPGGLEMWLTYLAQEHPWLSETENLRNRALFLDLQPAIRDSLQECTDKLHLESQSPPDWLLNLASFWHANQSKVLTMNYDVLVESAAKKSVPLLADCDELYPILLTPAINRCGAMEGGPPGVGTLQLFKLHGSTNWFYSGRGSFYGETIYFTQVENIWNPAETAGGPAQWSPVDDKVPFIVPPSIEKTHYFQHETVRSLWSKAGLAVRGARRLFCLGYSLPATDLTMRFLLSSSLQPDKTALHVVNTNLEAGKHLAGLLPQCDDVDATFVGDNAIPDFVSALVAGGLQ